MKWESKALIGNKTVLEMLTNDIDIVSEKIKLAKFHSEYDLKFLPEDLKSAHHLTLRDFAAHPGKLEDIPYSILEDDLPKIKPRHFSITNDLVTSKRKRFRFCFTFHRFNIGEE
jgi:hypothetical protein